MNTKVLLIFLIFSFALILTSGCLSPNIQTVELKTFVDSNITYTNFSCKTDAHYATITEFDHTCSFDIIDKYPNPNDIISIEYSYCQWGGNCYYNGTLTLTGLKPGNNISHQEFKFSEHLINSLATTKPTFNFKATRSTQV